MTIGRAFVSAISYRPQLIVAIHHKRCGLYAHDKFVHHLVSLGIYLENAVLIRPAVHIYILAMLHHLLRGTTLHGHVGHLDVTGNLVALGIDDKDAVVPYLRDVGLLVREEMDVTRRGEVGDAADFLERIRIYGKDHVRVVHHNPPHSVADNHALCHIAQFHAVGTEEDLVLHRPRLGVVVREGGIAILEIALVSNEKSPCRG